MAEYRAESSDLATHTQVDSGITSVTILAANRSRKGASIFNTDTNALYLRMDGGTATAATAHVVLAQNTYFEVPFKYRGRITGIWAGDGAGAANVVEYT